MPPPGTLLAIVGPMFAGKTTCLMQYAEEAFDQGWRVVIIHNLRDKRGGTKQNELMTHDGRHIQRTIQELYCQCLGDLFGVT